MRVIAGKARRARLVTLEGMDVRPTTDQIKETLFNILNPYLYECRFLDIFGGSGGIGIEALSRGADECVFIERDRRCQNIIEQNLLTTHLSDQAEILRMDYLAGLKELDRRGKAFDIIFMDPPYNKEYEQKALEFIDTSRLIHEETIIIVEASLQTVVDDSCYENIAIDREKIYKTNKHVFLSMK